MIRLAPRLLGCAASALVAMTSGIAVGLAPPHDESNGIACRDCHAPHPSGDALLPRDAAQEAVCKSCHNPTGMAASLSDVAMHVVQNETRTIDCGSCHDPHGPQSTTDSHPGGGTAENLRLVRGNIAKYVPGALEPALFQQRPTQFAFGPDDAPFNGICQSCHSQTAYHRRDGTTDNTHNLGANCVQCHPHDSGFLAKSCVACHATPQDNGDGTPVGGRRAVVGEFPTSTVHAHLRQNPVADDDCLVCHSVATHQSGVVRLVDPDDAAQEYVFTQAADLTGDPDLSNFCANCHDADGAQRLATPMDPFGNGNAPSDVKSRFQGTLQWNEWYGDFCFGSEGTMRLVNSHHDISDADQALSGAKIECVSCHGAHVAGRTQRVANPRDTTQPWTGTSSDFCLECHSGGTGPGTPGMPPSVQPPTIQINASGVPCNAPGASCPDGGVSVSGLRGLASCDYRTGPWWVSYTWTHVSHGRDSKRGWPGYSSAPGAEIDCTVCHDPHGSWTEANPEGNPYLIRDVVDGTPFVDDGVRPSSQWTGPPWETFGASREVVVAVNQAASPPTVDWGGATGLCSACHSNWLGAYDWHAYCNGCQTCHNHGQDWGNYDWGGEPQNATDCVKCGNGVMDGFEECDDGNTVSGDGCSNECTIEP